MTTIEPKYDVALSFAGEQRSYVERVASALTDAGVNVFYDDYEQVELWGKDLYSHLDYVYRKASRYCVIFISKSYAAKVWTSHERKSAQARALGENQEYILPARFDQTELPGLSEAVGYINLDSIEPEELASKIREKIGPPSPRPVFPRDLSRLVEKLENDPQVPDIPIAEVHDVAYSIYDALLRMTLEERTAITGVIVFGCKGELPNGVHVSLDKLSRYTKLPKAQLVEALGAVHSLNFKVRLRENPHRDEDELSNEDKDVFLSYWSSRAPDNDHATSIAWHMIRCISAHYCADHGLEIVTALSFQRLSKKVDVDVVDS